MKIGDDCRNKIIFEKYVCCIAIKSNMKLHAVYNIEKRSVCRDPEEQRRL